jgi:hypothetical protein
MLTAPRNAQDQLLDVLLKQYEQAWSERRNLDSLVWQTPTISLGIATILISGLVTLYGKGISWALVAIIGFGAFAVVLVGIVQLRKHRLFQMIRTSEMCCLESKIRDIVPSTYSMTFTPPDFDALRKRYPGTATCPSVPTCRLLDERSAYKWLFGLMCLVAFGLLVFSFVAMLSALRV